MTGPMLPGHWDVPGLPDNWPSLLADVLSELGADEFDDAWETLGRFILAKSRLIRIEEICR